MKKGFGTQKYTYKNYQFFLKKLIRLITSSKNNTTLINSFLVNNSDKINDKFAKILLDWQEKKLQQAPLYLVRDTSIFISNTSNFFLELPLGNRSLNLEIAINGYKIALTALSISDYPEEWATTLSNMGVAYLRRIEGKRVENLEFALTCLQDSLQIRTYEKFPYEWAVSQINLGAIYNERVKFDKAENQEQAIKAYSCALQFLDNKLHPYYWALANNNLGNVYCMRVYGERVENFKLAIAAYEAALQVYTCEAFPQDWAMLQNNLGRAYQDRHGANRNGDLKAAIAAYQVSLQVYTHEAFPQDWAMVQNHLGNAYCDLVGEQFTEFKQETVLYKTLLNIYNIPLFLHEWVTIQNDFLDFYKTLINQQLENLNLAILAYQSALQVYTPNTFLRDWAEIQNNLASVLSLTGQVPEAIECYKSAIETCNPNTSPSEYFRYGRNLGMTSFIFGYYIEAIEGFEKAIEAIEQSRSWANTDWRKESILSEAIDVYAGIIEAYIKTDKLDLAISYIERSKARNLLELLKTRDILPKGNIQEKVIHELQTLRREIVVEERRLEVEMKNQIYNTDMFVANNNHLNNLHQRLENFIKYNIQPHDPTFSLTQKVEAISFTEIQYLLPNHETALIEWYILNDRFIVFIIIKESSKPIIWQSLPQDLKNLVHWANTYFNSYYKNRKLWQSNLNNYLKQLANFLHLDHIISLLPKACNKLILVPHQFLHLFPLHALPIIDDLCLIDRFSQGISYIPSCQLLQISQNQHRPLFQNLFALQNPTADLPYADIEVSEISLFFQTAQVLVQEEATKATIQNIQDLSQIHCSHFSCHGVYNINSSLESYLLLANGERLTLGEVFNINLSKCRLVSLSACETGFVNFNSVSDEYVGFPSGFIYAGSPNIISSLWNINDLSTSLLMIRFYQNLKIDSNIARALNEAQIWLRDSKKIELQEWNQQLILSKTSQQEIQAFLDWFEPDEQPFSEKYYWAAFCAIGK
ncbi:CHAT domain-containing protein (plasmid) [Nostoc sp. C052]|uniref:CHAT domain-containing protein n=1 Tax=Nostoc sp. C052 TaxID=2576902 RepID=UPI0015C3B6F5|nr:CHAT domain-containing tetratricopeptide repeat protein [Nostoc sp. C052]QLE45748.1 CHAT domain-containing protein [Nostoc sp. C052]